MGRDEELRQAAKDYAASMCNDCSARLYCEDKNKKCAEYREQVKIYTDAAKWADEHPRNVWHDASEEPEYRNGGILCEHDLYYWVATQPYLSSICGNWHKKVEREHLKRWAYISDLLPKGGEE